MPANEVEVREAVEEGVTFRWLSTIAQAREGTVRLERMTLDESGVPHPTGNYDEIAGDCVILALGQDVDRSLLATASDVAVDDGLVRVDEQMMTGHAGIFAGGDVSDTTRSVTASLGRGRVAARRVDDFQEVVAGLDADTALYEARRCLSCGHCFGCDNCFGVCPDNAIHKIEPRDDGRAYEIDYDYCKGCGLCVAECPSGAIEIQPEPS